MNPFLYFFPFLLLIQILSGCHQVPSGDRHAQIVLKNNCEASKKIYYYDSLLTSNTLYIVTPDSLTSARFSKRALNIASCIGSMDLLNKFTQLEYQTEQGSDSARLELLYLRQELDENLTLSYFDVSSLLAEIDCEQQRMVEIRNYLQEIINKKTKFLNISSIVVSSASTLAAGGISLKDPDANSVIQGVTIIGAAVGTYLAIRQVFINKGIVVPHSRNPLGELWNMPTQSKIFSPNTWFFLTTPSYVEGDTLSKRDKLIQEFYEEGFLEDAPSNDRQKKIQLFFGTGGKYDVDMLTDRINMLELLETKINLMKYDLKRLQQELLLKD